MYTTAHHPSQCSARSIQLCLLTYFFKVNLNTIFHLCLGLANGLFPSNFPNKNPVYTSLFPPTIICPTHLIILDFITQTIFGVECRSWRLSHCHLLQYNVTSSPKAKYSAQHSILQHPHARFLPQGKRLSFTTIWNKQNYSSVSFNLHIFRKQTGKQKIWVWMAAGISWAQSALN